MQSYSFLIIRSSILLLLVSRSVFAINTDLFLPKCKIDDTKCLKELVQVMISIISKGDPDIGLNLLDPLFIPQLEASTSNIQLHLKDITVTNLSGCIAKKVRYNVDKSSLLMKLMCSVDLDGHYDMKGKLLFIPIEGNGKMHAYMEKAVFSVDSELSKIKNEKGETHLNIVNWSHSYELKDNAILNFENLFNGNEVLGKAAQDVIANNSNEVISEVGSPIIQAIISKVVEAVQKIYTAIPVQDFILE